MYTINAMQSGLTQLPWDESSSSLWTVSDTPNFCFAGFKTGCATTVSGNKSSSASTWARSSTPSRSVSNKLPFMSARSWFNHLILKSGWSARSCMTSLRKSLNQSMPSELQRLSSVFRWLAGSDLDVPVYFSKIEDFQCSGTVSSRRTVRANSLRS
jgi:hypothetical protein